MDGGQGQNRTADTRIFSRSDTVTRNTQDPLSQQNSSKRPLPSIPRVAVTVSGSGTKPLHITSTLQTQSLKRPLIFSVFSENGGYSIQGATIRICTNMNGNEGLTPMSVFCPSLLNGMNGATRDRGHVGNGVGMPAGGMLV